MSGDDDAPPGVPALMEWQVKQREYEVKKARAKALKLRLTCTICGAKAKLNCPCETTQYCSVECQRIDWRDRGHRKACKKIRNERAAEAARAEAEAEAPTPPRGPATPPPETVFYGPAPRSHADEVRARIAAEHEAARARREANPEREPLYGARYGSRCPICYQDWDLNKGHFSLSCCCRLICNSCEDKTRGEPCALCRMPYVDSEGEILARLRRHVNDEVPEALVELGSAYSVGDLGLTKSAKKAAKIWKRAAELGNNVAMTQLGRCYYQGDGVKLDKKKGLKLWRVAASHGAAPAQYNLSVVLHEQSSDTPEEDFHYARLAAEQGLTAAEFDIGISFWKGLGVAVDLDEARRWLERAVAKGHPRARGALADLNLAAHP